MRFTDLSLIGLLGAIFCCGAGADANSGALPAYGELSAFSMTDVQEFDLTDEDFVEDGAFDWVEAPDEYDDTAGEEENMKELEEVDPNVLAAIERALDAATIQLPDITDTEFSPDDSALALNMTGKFSFDNEMASKGRQLQFRLPRIRVPRIRVPRIRIPRPSCGRNGWYGNKRRIMGEVERDNCGWATGGRRAMCDTIWGNQEGGEEALELSLNAGVACMACTAGCAGCAASSLARGITRRILAQMVRLKTELVRSLRQQGTAFGRKLLNDLTGMLSSFVLRAARSLTRGNGVKGGCLPSWKSVDVGINMGIAYYGGENCVCGVCVPAMNAMRPWISWYVDIDEPRCQ